MVAVDFAPPKPPGRFHTLGPVLVILASLALICGAAVTYLLLR
jgi:hypothetical protein